MLAEEEFLGPEVKEHIAVDPNGRRLAENTAARINPPESVGRPEIRFG